MNPVDHATQVKRRAAMAAAQRVLQPERQLYRPDKKWRAANHRARLTILNAEKRWLRQGRGPQ